MAYSKGKKTIISNSCLSLKDVSVIIDPNTPIYAFYRVVFQVIRPIFCNKDKFSIVRKSVHIILNPVCTIIRCFSVNSKICSNRDTQIIKAVSNILDLTLFPSGGTGFLWKMCSRLWNRIALCRYRNEEG